GGSIGSSDVGSPVGVNNNAIDTDVTRLSVSGDDGVYIRETDDLLIDAIANFDVTVTVTRANFDAATSNEQATVSVTTLTESGSNPGPIKIVSSGGALVINQAITATGAGDVLLQALSDVVVNAGVIGGTGNVTVAAGDDVHVNAAVSTT